ncbi:MAG: response regulator [Candidatus Competibacteraceae bacterium]|nr:response regulator [Candidatus Competibacteraceae bacterium]
MYSVLGLLEQLLKLDREPDEKRTLKMIKEAAATVNRHIDDILDVTQLARLEKKGKRLPSNEPVNLWGILETVAAMQQPLMNTRDLYLDIIVTPQVPTVVKSNIKAFREIVSNLLGNAVKYTQHGGITVWFETVERARPTLRLRVADSGCGIPEDRLDSIFREFEQVDEAYNRRHGGTGLGLSFVKKNCSLLGGHVTVASALERGSTFTVELPIHPADDVPSGRGADSARLLGNRRGLVADERSTFRASVISRFQSLRIAIEEQAIDLTALAAARPPGLFYDLLIVQNLRKQPEKMLPDLIRGLRPWANLLIDFETEYNVEIQRFLQGAGVGIVFWSGARRADLEAALLVATQQKISERAGLLAPLAPTSGLLAGRKILVVEDYEINRAIMMKQLYENGASVLEAEDGDTAVMLAAEPGLDLILMDIQMPGKDGITAIQEIRHLSSGAHLPILGFTASVDEPTLNRILNAGADGVLNKPISESDLIKGVRQAIQKVASRSWRPAH